ncbi:MAG: YihA family ribosome biogenesis GTP-binding protein [Deltaproteobacteria bacterium]|nr:YihA family ribosome biogenesis GTP-binding protein [Deltaproteobacteria bacterium]
MAKKDKGGPVRFLLSAHARHQWPDEERPEIAFVGRSNVGKSSCLNTLVGKKGVARVSKTPGRTQAINFFDIQREGREMRFADLPGYGFAKVPRSVQRTWEKMVGSYLAERESLALVVVLVDLRRDPTDLDEHMIRWLADEDRRGLVVMTKADKISKNQRLSQQAKICRGLGLPREESMLFSSVSKDGRPELWSRIVRAADEWGVG